MKVDEGRLISAWASGVSGVQFLAQLKGQNEIDVATAFLIFSDYGVIYSYQISDHNGVFKYLPMIHLFSNITRSFSD